MGTGHKATSYRGAFTLENLHRDRTQGNVLSGVTYYLGAVLYEEMTTFWLVFNSKKMAATKTFVRNIFAFTLLLENLKVRHYMRIQK
jgi:hypothetical protein